MHLNLSCCSTYYVFVKTCNCVKSIRSRSHVLHFPLTALELINWLRLNIIVHPSPPPRAACSNLSELIKKVLPFPPPAIQTAGAVLACSNSFAPSPCPFAATRYCLSCPAEWCCSRHTLSKRLLSRYRTCWFGTCHQIYTSQTKCGSQTEITNF